MSTPETQRTLVAPGELRPDILRLFGDPVEPTDILLAAPGLMDAFEGWAELVANPARRFSKERARQHASALLDQFVRATDQLPHTPEWEDLIRGWIEALEANIVQIRHFDRHPLHSRLISTPRASVIPQAPLSSELRSSSQELRIELTGAAHERAREWFENVFAQSRDISETVSESLRNSWAGDWCSARDMYHYVLAQYFRDIVDFEQSETDDNPILEYLTEFQQEAYNYAKSILGRYGGVFLADVVGLGKTFIAMALLAHLARRTPSEHAVVIAPPSVLPSWRELASEFKVELVTVSLGKLDDLEQYSDRTVLVVDESHNFRNKGTQRHEALETWLRPTRSEPSRRKVILLSATPQNNAPTDIENQINLFPDNYAKLPYRGESLGAFLREVTAGRASMVELLQHVVVRRTRRYIKAEYPDAKIRARVSPGLYVDRPLQFPKRVSGDAQCLRYAIDRTYGPDFFLELLTAIETMRYPLQGIGKYVRADRANDTRLSRHKHSGTSLRGLFRVLLLKRLESSTHALTLTIGRLYRRLEVAAQCVRQGKPLDTPGVDPWGDEGDEAGEGANRGLSLDLFDVEALQRDLELDLGTVRNLQSKLEHLQSKDDEKRLRLEEYLRLRPPITHRTLIFTQFADTANYLGKTLGTRFGRTEVVTGGTSGIMSKARRFAPKANRRDIPPDQQIDLLISTDVLSEGVNLQDADTLINFDLHWNPLRLIQRAGRIDRISSEKEEIHIASFLPQRELEASLRLEEVLRKRIGEFIQAFGEDSQVLPSSEMPDPAQMESAYTGAALESSDSPDGLDALSRHVDHLYRLRRTAPDELSRVQSMRPGRRALGTLPASVAATRSNLDWEFWEPDGSDGVQTIDVRKALDILAKQAEAGEPERSPEAGEGLELVEQARQQFEPIARQREHERMHPRLAPHEMFVLSSLETLRKDAPEHKISLLERMEAWVRSSHSQSVLQKQAKTWKKEKYSAQAVFDELRPLLVRFPTPTPYRATPELVGAVIASKPGREG